MHDKQTKTKLFQNERMREGEKNVKKRRECQKRKRKGRKEERKENSNYDLINIEERMTTKTFLKNHKIIKR